MVTSDQGILNAAQQGEASFCRATSLTDMNYCYPDIKTNTDLNQVIQRQQTNQEGCLCLERFASSLRNALILVYSDDNSGRIFVGEQMGLVTIFFKNGSKINDPFLDITSLVLTSSSAGDERGFLGMAFHPNFASNQKLYVYFSIGREGNFKNRVSEFKILSTNRDKVDRNSERVIMEIYKPFSNHNGGQLLFGSDNYLYIMTGDGGSGGDPYNNAQNLSVLLGKVLRIDVDSRTGNLSYGIPSSNPFINNPKARPEIYAYGCRNMWRCSFDRGDFKTGLGKGRLFCGDVGQARYEEVDIIKNGGNYGWNAREGFECYTSSTCGRIGPEEYPIYAYNHSVGTSITGGYVYRGCLYPNLNGLYIYADYGNGRLFRLKDVGSSQWENKELLMCNSNLCTNGLVNTYDRNVLSFGEDFDGDVYMLTTSNPSTTSYSGNIYRLVDPLRRSDPSVCKTGAAQSGPDTTATTTRTTTTTTTPRTTISTAAIRNTPTTTKVTTTVLPNLPADVAWLCSFEQPNGGMTWCDIQQGTADQFDWTLWTGPTPSDPTGPDSAYNGKFYIYIEASDPRRPGDTAIIYLPINSRLSPTLSPYCLSFSYHMFGFHINELQVFVEDTGGRRQIVWRKSGDQGNYWYRGVVTVTLSSIQKVGFIGVRGNEYSGDIALDNIALSYNACR